ncbi:MAG: AAA family ATPase, partial [Planctomycetes bacterium]|nr:AAA family ATPase [Planctomycetota bacterium]
LRKEGFRALSVHDGEDALDVASREHFDLIILDLMLPGMDGLDVCKALKKERKERQKAHDELKATWEQEKSLAQDVIKLRQEIRASENGNGAPTGAPNGAPNGALSASEGTDVPAGPRTGREHKDAAGTPPTELSQPRAAAPHVASAPRGGRSAEETAAAPAKRPIAEIRKDLDAATKKLEDFIGKRNPLVPLQVDSEVVAQILSDWTGIPAGSMVKDTAEAMLTFESRIGERIIGQDHVLAEIGKRLRIAAGKLQDPALPLAVFLMVGPSGTGKTETALALADLIFGGERFMTTLNMTEYSSSMNVSRLIGSAPGLVGFGEGGVLTEAVRQRPYSVVLLDEMEKAHMDVNLLFMQVFDKGALTDSEGRVANFKNTVIMMTSNEASDMIMEMCADGEMPSMDEMRTAIQPILEARFTPAFVGRTTVIPFYPLSQETLRKIVDLKMNKIRRRLQDLYRLDLELTPAVGDEIGNRCQQITIGARLINLIINETVLPEIAKRILEIMGSEAKYEKLVIDAKDGEFTYEFK